MTSPVRALARTRPPAPDRRLLRTMTGHSDGVQDASFSADGKTIVTAGRDNTVRVWNAQNGDPLMVLHTHKATVRSATFTHKSMAILSAGDDGNVLIESVDPKAYYLKGCRILASFSDAQRHVVLGQERPEDLAKVLEKCPK